jgi:hypothetical protein
MHVQNGLGAFGCEGLDDARGHASGKSRRVFPATQDRSVYRRLFLAWLPDMWPLSEDQPQILEGQDSSQLSA